MGRGGIKKNGIDSVIIHESGHLIEYCKKTQELIPGRCKREQYIRRLKELRIKYTGGGLLSFTTLNKTNREAYLYMLVAGLAYTQRICFNSKRITWFDLLWYYFLGGCNKDINQSINQKGFFGLKRRAQEVIDSITNQDIEFIEKVKSSMEIEKSTGDKIIKQHILFKISQDYVDIKRRKDLKNRRSRHNRKGSTGD